MKKLLVLALALVLSGTALAQVPGVGFVTIADINNPAVFPDLGLNRFGRAAAILLAQLGIVTGFPDGTFAPFEGATREQVAAIIQRLLSTIVASMRPSLLAPGQLAGTLSPERILEGLSMLNQDEQDAAIAQLAAAVQALQGSVVTAADLAAVQDIAVSAQADAVALAQRVADLEGARVANEARITALENLAADAAAAIAALQAQTEGNTNDIAAIRDFVILLRQDIVDLQQATADLAAALEAAGRFAAAEQVQQILDQLSALRSALDQTNAEVGAINNLIFLINTDLRTARGDIIQLGRRVGDLEGAVSGLDGRVSTAEANIAANSADIAALQTFVTLLRVDVDEHTDRINAIEAVNAAQDVEIARIDAEFTVNGTLTITFLSVFVNDNGGPGGLPFSAGPPRQFDDIRRDTDFDTSVDTAVGSPVSDAGGTSAVEITQGSTFGATVSLSFDLTTASGTPINLTLTQTSEFPGGLGGPTFALTGISFQVGNASVMFGDDIALDHGLGVVTNDFPGIVASLGLDSISASIALLRTGAENTGVADENPRHLFAAGITANFNPTISAFIADQRCLTEFGHANCGASNGSLGFPDPLNQDETQVAGVSISGLNFLGFELATGLVVSSFDSNPTGGFADDSPDGTDSLFAINLSTDSLFGLGIGLDLTQFNISAFRTDGTSPDVRKGLLHEDGSDYAESIGSFPVGGHFNAVGVDLGVGIFGINVGFLSASENDPTAAGSGLDPFLQNGAMAGAVNLTLITVGLESPLDLGILTLDPSFEQRSET
ncbi:MAG: S-layer homology domain-containing protein, partial [Deinococcus sp.]|nr:S-layer homology domain-containing protein [Deinococcus sp.]